MQKSALRSRILLILSSGLLTLSLFACRTANPSAQGSGAAESDVDYGGKGGGDGDKPHSCVQDQVCTREFQPHICKQDDVRAKGSNLCEAQKALKEELCKQKKTYDEKKVTCVRELCEEKACTAVYDPVTCTFDGKTFKGSNGCEAINKIRKYVCDEKKDFVEDKVKCVKDDDSSQNDQPTKDKPKGK
jgi:hypothetical protein